MRQGLRISLALACAALALVLSGCVTIESESATQANTIGDVTLTTRICLPTGTSDCPFSATNSNEGAAAASVAELMIGYRLPVAAGAPDHLTASYVAPASGSINLAKNDSYASELQRVAPAPDGFEWVGYLSDAIDNADIQPGARVDVQGVFTLGRGGDGAPFPSPLVYRTVAGARSVDVRTAGSATRPVACGIVPTQLNGDTVCVDSPFGQSTFLSNSTLPIKDLGVLNGDQVDGQSGSTVSVPFKIRSSGMNGAPVFDLTGATTIPGATASPAQSTFAPQPDDATVPVSLTIPAGTPPGVYDVTLTAALGSAEPRTGTTKVNVVTPPPAAPATPATPAAPADTTAPGLKLTVSKQRLTAVLKKGLKVGVSCSEACNIVVKAGSLGSGRGALAGAGTKTVVVKFSARNRRALAHRRSLKLTVQVTATDLSGNASNGRKTLKLKR